MRLGQEIIVTDGMEHISNGTLSRIYMALQVSLGGTIEVSNQEGRGQDLSLSVELWAFNTDNSPQPTNGKLLACDNVCGLRLS